MPGTLYIVSLPIGNPDDITVRSLRILRFVDLIAAEDTRVSSQFCAQHTITTPCISYRKRSDRDTAAPILLHLEQGNNVALICDAGTPAIADPGQELIKEAIRRGIPLDAAPGPVAAIVALVLSGLPTGRFAFDGFPPRARADRAEFFRGLADEARTILLYESAATLRATLQELANVLAPNRRIVIAKDLTTPDQTLFRSTLMEALQSFHHQRKAGRYTLVIAGKTVNTRKPDSE